MAQFKAYPKYKDSGVEWLGEVPNNFSCIKLKQLAIGNLKYGANEAAEQENKEHPRYIRITDIKEDGTLNIETFKSLPPDIAEPYLLSNNDILFARSGATVGKTFKYSCLWGICCFAGYLIKISINTKYANTDYIFYYLNSYSYWEYILSNQSQSTIQNVNAEKYANFTIAVPNIDEQERIVSYLNLETAKIDALIAKQEKLIELLEEQRKSVISHAVTKGLDPNAPMKDSGVEWLGKVPEHWKISNIKRSTYLKGRVGWKGLTSNEFEVNSFAYLVTGTDFKQKYVNWSSCYQINESRYEDDPYIQLKNGDLLMTKDGTIGKLAIVKNLNKSACLNSGIFLIRPEKYYLTEFMYWVLNSNAFNLFFVMNTTGSTILHLYQNVFERFVFSYPNFKEQERIVSYLNLETTKINTLITKQKRLIEKLKEYRASVISHAVTGKIDVRELAA